MTTTQPDVDAEEFMCDCGGTEYRHLLQLETLFDASEELARSRTKQVSEEFRCARCNSKATKVLARRLRQSPGFLALPDIEIEVDRG